MKIKIIANGSTKLDRFIRRWGISFLAGDDVLFDTFGDPDVFLKNAEQMRVDFSKIRHIVISHEDWDHTSGLWDIIDQHKNITVYICPHTSRGVKDRICSLGVPYVEVARWLRIKENVFLTGEIMAESAGGRRYEQALVVKFLKRLTVITGCAHPGVIRILDDVKVQFVKERIWMVMGGLHLKDAAPSQIAQVVSALRARGVSKVAPMHCTGKTATDMMKKEYGIDFLEARAGSIIEV